MRADPPAWLGPENPDWPGNYTVAYWDPGWQAIIAEGDGCYLAGLISLGFDGVVLAGVGDYRWFIGD